MTPEMMGMQQDIPSIKELWKNEKTRYRHWVIILAIGLIVISALTWTSFVLYIIDKDEIIEKIKNTLEKKVESEAKRKFNLNIVYASMISVATLTGVVWYFASLVQVYKHKNFANLSRWPTLIILVGAFISFIWLVQVLFFKQDQAFIFATKASTFLFVTRIIYILIYFAASSPISRVRRIFLVSEHLEKLKKDQKFQKMRSQLDDALRGGHMPYGPMGPVIDPNENPNIPSSTQQTTQQTNNVVSEKEQKFQKLKSLSVDKLKEVAKRLSISGYEIMNKDELIKAILRIYDY